MTEEIHPKTLDDLHAEFKKVADALANNARAVDHLSAEVARTTRGHETLSAEHNALTNRVNHIDLRISVMEETTRLQNKHNEEVHKDFKESLHTVERTLIALADKIDDSLEKMQNTFLRVDDKLSEHMAAESIWQRHLLITGVIIAGSGLFATLAFFGRWIFLKVAGA